MKLALCCVFCRMGALCRSNAMFLALPLLYALNLILAYFIFQRHKAKAIYTYR